MAKKSEDGLIKKTKERLGLLFGKTKHSPAGRRYLAGKVKKKKEKTQPVYFKGIKRKSDVERLKEAGLSKEDLKKFGYK